MPPEPVPKIEAPPAPETPRITLKPPPGFTSFTRIGILLPLSGREAELGESMLRAAEIALFDLADQDFVLMPYDTEGTPEGARAAVTAAVSDGVRLLLGPLFSESVAAAAPLAHDAGINMVVFSNNREVARQKIYLIGLLPRSEISRVVSYARSRGVLRFAALAPDSAFGRRVVDELRTAAERDGGEMSRVVFFAPDGSDLSASVRRLARYEERQGALRERRLELEAQGDSAAARMLSQLEGIETLGEIDYDALLVPVGGARLKEIAALLPFYDVDTAKIRLLGMSSWLMPGLGREPPLVGGWFAAPHTDAGADFKLRFGKLFGGAPDPLAPFAYDATALAAILARNRRDGAFSADALTSPNGFAGTAGIFRFLSTGEAERGLAVLEVEAWQFRVVSPSPKSFEDFAN